MITPPLAVMHQKCKMHGLMHARHSAGTKKEGKMPTVKLVLRPYWERVLRFPYLFIVQYRIMHRCASIRDSLLGAWLLSRLTLRRRP